MTAAEKSTLVGTAGKTLSLGGRELTLQWPTPSDQLTIEDKMVSIAQKLFCTNPLVHVHAIPQEEFNGPDRIYALERALALGSGGGAEPSVTSVVRAYNSVDGLRYRIWRLTRRTMPELSESDVATFITEDNRPDVIDALDQLLSALDPKKKAETGTSS